MNVAACSQVIEKDATQASRFASVGNLSKSMEPKFLAQTDV